MPATVASMGKPVTWRARHPRWRLAEGVVKGVFTTSPKETTEVFVKRDGEIVIQPAAKSQQTTSHA